LQSAEGTNPIEGNQCEGQENEINEMIFDGFNCLLFSKQNPNGQNSPGKGVSFGFSKVKKRATFLFLADLYRRLTPHALHNSWHANFSIEPKEIKQKQKCPKKNKRDGPRCPENR